MKQMSPKNKAMIILILIMVLVFNLTACEKPKPESYDSKREGKVVETPLNTMTEVMVQGKELNDSDLGI